MLPKAPKPPKPFPWKCHHCFKNEVFIGAANYEAEVRHDGRLYKFTIPELHLPVCQACGEKVFTEEVDDQIGQALRTHLRLLSPDEIRAELERLDITQKEAAETLGIAEATLSRWLTGAQIQSRAMDNYLRIFLDFREVRERLQSVRRDPSLVSSGAGGLFSERVAASDSCLNRIRKHFPNLPDVEQAFNRARAFQIAPGVN